MTRRSGHVVLNYQLYCIDYCIVTVLPHYPDMKFHIHIHIRIHRFYVDIHGYIHIHRCVSCRAYYQLMSTQGTHLYNVRWPVWFCQLSKTQYFTQPGFYQLKYTNFIPISSILFNSLLQLLFADRNLFLGPDVDHLFHNSKQHSLSLFCEQHTGLTKMFFSACWWDHRH